MDQSSFDQLTRLLGGTASRRHALRAVIAAALAGGTTADMLAAPRRKGRGKGQGKNKNKGKGKGGNGNSGSGNHGCAGQQLKPSQDFLGCDYSGRNLRGEDLHSSSFDDVDFSGADLCGADFHSSSFAATDFSGANLTDADFDQTSHSEVSFANAHLAGASFEVATFSEVDFSGADLTGVNFRGATFDEVNFEGAIFCRTLRPDGSVDDRDCDACDNACGVCEACDTEDCPPPDCCVDPETGDGFCTDTQNGDPLNCGGCNEACFTNLADNCINGECACGDGPECPGGSTCIEGECVSPCDEGEVFCVTEGAGECITGVCCEAPAVGPGCPEGQTCIAGGCIGEGQYRIVLRWGPTPEDIDSHLWLPTGNPFHIYYSNRGDPEDFPFAELDIDDTESFGPETITIFQTQTGSYRYAVYNYADSCTDSLAESGATVQLFRGGTLVDEWDVPTNDASARWWHVFNLAFDANGDGTVTEVNQLVDDAPAPAGYNPDEGENDEVCTVSLEVRAERAAATKRAAAERPRQRHRAGRSRRRRGQR